MNKTELIHAVSEAIGTQEAAATAVNAILDAITATLKKGDNVVLAGFGAFKVKARAARTGRNPRTGESVKIAKKNVLSFKAGKELKAAIQ